MLHNQGFLDFHSFRGIYSLLLTPTARPSVRKLPTCDLYTSRAQKMPTFCQYVAGLHHTHGWKRRCATPWSSQVSLCFPIQLHAQSLQDALLHLCNIQHFCMGSVPSHRAAEGKGTAFCKGKMRDCKKTKSRQERDDEENLDGIGHSDSFCIWIGLNLGKSLLHG